MSLFLPLYVYVYVSTHICVSFVCLLARFVGQPLPLNCYLSPGGTGDGCVRAEGGFGNRDAAQALGPGLRSPNSFVSSAFLLFS